MKKVLTPEKLNELRKTVAKRMVTPKINKQNGHSKYDKKGKD